MPELELAGVACGQILRKVQKYLKRSKQQVTEKEAAAFAATLSCVVITRIMPALYKPFISPPQWLKIRSELRDRTLNNADYTEVAALLQSDAANMLSEKLNDKISFPTPICDDIKHKRCADMLSRIYAMLDLQPHIRVNESTWIAHHIWTLFSRSYDPEIRVMLDFPSSSRNLKRPDLMFWYKSHCLLLAEIKTPTAAATDKAKELVRLIQRGVEAIKSQLSNWGNALPTIYLARFDGALCTAYELTLAKRIFCCHEVAEFALPMLIDENSAETCARAVVAADQLLARVRKVKRHLEESTRTRQKQIELKYDLPATPEKPAPAPRKKRGKAKEKNA
ncbi:hypothetical protein HDU87_003488 [Geranomyces variabilis]|uniref:Uncharacterized protein n=1 Tax=Geranomyces variabilis TaxID=109894 RepID=A0AAD5XSM4_9FUNG|nr:hypothetical protein HDU87_003488 [Geranomyces variabilis]